MITLPLYDYPTRSASGFMMRYVLPRTGPPQLVGILDRRAPFQALTFGDVLLGSGHGSPSEFCGDRDMVLMDTLHIPDVRGKVVKLLACETGQVLGQSIIDAGADSFSGYIDDYVWVCDADFTTTPWRDEMAASTLMPVIASMNAILDGMTAEQAFQIELENYTRNAVGEEDELIKSCLLFNRDNAILLGKSAARVPARPDISLPVPPPPLIVLS